MALALHELATNAAKYGALSTEGGRVSLKWRLQASAGERRLRIVWRESGGPPVKPPSRRGFGTRMIQRGLAADLNGKVDLDYAASGVICTIEADLADLPAAPLPPVAGFNRSFDPGGEGHSFIV